MMVVSTLFAVTCVVTLGAQVVAPAVTAAPSAGGETKAAAAAEPAKSDTKTDGKSETKTEADPKKAGDAAAESGDSIKRPNQPPRVPDPREFDVRPGEDGLVSFNFYGQSWPDLLQWLAVISDHSLDWQELPKDYVNITTQRPYTVLEVHDLFNRLLLERGYTMVRQGRILSVNRINKIDPSLLTRVDDESQLLDLPAHDLVKITFKLPDELKADKAAEDVKPLLSPHAKVQPLLATNRLLVIDAVINLREVSLLVNAEHAAATGHVLPKEFVLRFARADQVADQVMILLGLDPSSRRTPQELQVEQQRLQLFQQMQQSGKDVTKFLRPDDSPKVFLAVNGRNNSILANAPPAEMRVIEQAIQQLDVPSSAAAGAVSGALSLVRYQLATIAPQSIVSALEELGDLDPRTRLRTDTDTKVVFANATAGDHGKIRAVIDNLDGTGRQLEVIWLRRLPADAVAATIHSLMVGDKKEEDDSRGRSYFYYPYRNEPQKPNTGTFRVDADIERNRLLLWATAAELQEVRSFLEKLGEIPGRAGNPNTVRFLDPRNKEATLRILEQLRRAWNGPNELRIETSEAPTEAKETSATPKPETEARSIGAMAHLVASRGTPGDAHEVNVAVSQPRQASAPPIIITVQDDGRIMLSSRDTTALDQLEDLLSSLTPPAPDFKVYYLKYALASMVTLNLDEYFAEEEEFDTQDNWMRAYWGFDFQSQPKSGSGLSQRRKIRFIYDYDTNSVLVANASPNQLAVVEALIKIYDMPPSEDSISARSFQIFKLEYSRADAVAKTIKEVYRDLLSSKDKDFEQRGEKEQVSQTNNYYRLAGAGEEGKDKPTKVKASFQGALAVGIDEVSNTVIVSAQEEWMPSIAQMIKYLDANAVQQTSIAVSKIDGQTNAKVVSEALAKIIGEAWVGNRRPKPAPPQPVPGAPGAQVPQVPGVTPASTGQAAPQ